MKFSVQNYNIKEQNNNNLKQQNNCIVVGIFENCKLSYTAEQLNIISNGYINSLLNIGDIRGEINQHILLYNVPNISFKRILLIGCGKENELDEYKYKKIIKKTINILNKTNSLNILCFLTTLNIKNCNNYWKIRYAVEIIKENSYIFNKFKSNKIKQLQLLNKIIFNISENFDLSIGERAIYHGLAISLGIKSAKDLANMPPNICNSTYLASKACKLADKYENITTKIIGRKQMKELSMNAYLAVGQGSKNESLMSIIKYNWNKDINNKPIVLIGKGLTFDSGGISIKPSNNMDEMKYDMCGAAVVYGIMKFIIELKLPINVIGILSGCENMLSSKSYRPGDILKTMSGNTIEVINTDAEGRLVLCDTLTYVERFNPDIVIDIATLTGACIIALGNHYTGLMSNYYPLVNELLKAAKETNDKVWQLPLSKEFSKQLESNIADFTNTGDRSGGAITAGCFLQYFANKYKWAHLDIAGTAWKSGKIKEATGRPVTLLAQFLLNRIYKNYDI